jgi:ABC-type uncharacterized transport system
MKLFPSGRRDIIMACVLLLAVAVYAARIASYWETAVVEVGRVKTSHVSTEIRERLARLHEPVFLTYYVTARASMPSHMRRVERGVTAILDALARASGDRVEYQRVDPDADLDARQYAARHGVAPFRARSVERDAYSERTIWSALTIRYGDRPEAVINGIGPEYLPRLQHLILEHLVQLEQPRRPRVALSHTAGFTELAAELSARTDVVTVDIDRTPAPPADVDVLFWLEPDGDPTELRVVDEFLALGRSVIIAGNQTLLALRDNRGDLEASFTPAETGLDATLGHFGLRTQPGLVLDASAAELPRAAGMQAPFLIRSVPSSHDFRALHGQPNGALLFLAPTAIALDGPRLDTRGWSAHVLVTTSDRTAIAPVPVSPVAVRRLSLDAGVVAPKLPLAVFLRPVDPWKGFVVAFGATTPFVDGFFSVDGAAHKALLRTLIDNLASPDRLVLHQTGRTRPRPLPEMAPRERLAWRLAVVLIPPVLLIGMGLSRRSTRRLRASPNASPAWRPFLWGTTAVAGIATAAWWIPTDILRADVSRDRVNELAPQTRVIAARMRGSHAVGAELVFSPADRLPPAMRPGVRQVNDLLRELARAGADISTTRVRPDELAAPELERLRRLGIDRVILSENDDGVTTVRKVFASLRLTSGDRSETLHFTGPTSFANLEFRMAFALRRLETGNRPRLAFASDTPRLTPAEAHEQYQTQSLTAPMGTDAYSLARQLLAEHGFAVRHVDVRQPTPLAQDEVLVWVQPRRPLEGLLNFTIRHLHNGGRVLLAAQHFNIQARQYRGAGFGLVYWPQPQWPEIDELYFPKIGIHLVREVLFDELSTSMQAETQVNRGAGRPEIDRQVSTLPFVIRASASHFQGNTNVTNGLGDQAFISGSHIRWDDASLRARGIRATPLITTSDHTWSYPWKGGWIPNELLTGPPPKDGQPAWIGRQALAVLFQGSFPLEVVQRQGETAPVHATDDDPTDMRGHAGTLLLIGGSELFKNHRLRTPEFRADHLLLNAVAGLALDDDLAALAGRRSAPRGFGRVEPSSRILWRAGVIGTPVALVIGLALARRMRWRVQPRAHAA